MRTVTPDQSHDSLPVIAPPPDYGGDLTDYMPKKRGKFPRWDCIVYFLQTTLLYGMRLSRFQIRRK